jgi:hypothetical protein
MKRTFTLAIILLVFCCCQANAQYLIAPQPPRYSIVNTASATLNQIIDTMYANSNPADTAEGGETDNINTFKMLWQGRVIANSSSGPNMFSRYYSDLRMAMATRATSCTSIGFSGAWQSAGPESMPQQVTGYTNAIWADTASDSGYMLAGSVYGGLFKTVDAGGHWANITDNSPIAGGMMGVINIAVDPVKIDTIYLGTAGAAILKSYDRGATWQQEFIQMGAWPSVEDTVASSAVFYSDDGTRLYAIYQKQVFTRLTGSSGWVDITPAVPAIPLDTIIGWNSLAVVPQHPGHLFVSGQYTTMHKVVTDTVVRHVKAGFIWESTNAGATWNCISTNIDTDIVLSYIIGGGFVDDTTIYRDTDMTLFKLSVPDTNGLYTICVPLFPSIMGIHRYTGGGLYKYHFNSSSPKWSNNSRSLPDPNPFKFELAVSNADTNDIYYGTLNPYFSHDGGSTLVGIGSYYGAPTHGDIRNIYIQHASAGDSGNSDRVYFATDGGASEKSSGVNMSTSALLSTKDVSGSGLACGTYWSFDVSDAGDGGMGGMIHDGLVTYEPDLSPKWQSVGVSDAWGAAMDKTVAKRGYGWLWGDSLDVTAPAGVRQMGRLNTFPQPSDPGYHNYSVAKSIETDGYGNIYVAGNDLWRKQPSDTAFVKKSGTGSGAWAFPTGHIDYYGAVMAINPFDTTYEGYLLYNTEIDTIQHIYYRNRFIPSFTSAQELIIRIPGPSHHINHIATNSNNTEQIWVCQMDDSRTTYSDGTRYRVQYSDNHGGRWVDISTGLPQYLPPRRIVYDEQTGYLYCATDVGIYKYDFNLFNWSDTFTNSEGHLENNTVGWMCFNDGAIAGHDFPNVAVYDLKISHHCGSKLYAATFGRSIWVTDLGTAPASLPNTITISGNPTWSGSQYVTGNIDIPPGATLTLSGDILHMPKNGKIIVEAGGKLVVNGSKITNDCDGCLWKGIQARGHTYQPQVAADQGWVVIKNGSIIENADTAVSNFNLGIGFGSTGGVIQASNSYFINNHNNATFFAYDNFDPLSGLPRPNLSYFSNCTFLLNNNYRGTAMGHRMNHMVYLSGIEGINFQGCQFLNRDAAQDRSGYGIYAWNAGFTVSPYCPGISTPTSCPSLVRSRFSGFTNGISIGGAMGYDPVTSINQADFDSVSVGVNAWNIDNVSVTSSNFKVGHGLAVTALGVYYYSASCLQNIGILYMNPMQFRIEQNNFQGIPSGIFNWVNYGTIVGESGAAWNKVLLCSFDNLNLGVYALGLNRDLSRGSHESGLQVLCNTFTRNVNDIFIEGDGIVRSGPEGIATDQGTPGTYSPNSAGDIFSAIYPGIINNTGYINYYYQTSVLPERPTTSTPLLVSIFATGPKTCTSTLRSGGGSTAMAVASTGTIDASALADYKASFLTNKTSLQGYTATYTSLIDRGNTDSMITVIDASTDTATLLTSLESISPYNSIKALTEVANTTALPHTSMMTLVKQNPDDLRDQAFVSLLQSVYSLSGVEMDTLAARSLDTTERTSLEQTIENTSNTMSDEANIIMMALKAPSDPGVSIYDTSGAGICTDSNSIYYMLDSNSYYRGFDSIDRWLQNIGDLWTYYARLQYRNFRGNVVAADAIYTEIGHLIHTPIDTDMYVSYGKLWNAAKSAESDGRDIFSLNADELSTLDTSMTPVITYDRGASVMSSLTSSYYPDVPARPTPCMSSSTGSSSRPGDQHGAQPISDNKTSSFSAYPNPASGTVTFAYNVPDGGDDVKITVVNIIGEKVMEMHTGNNTGKINWDTQSISSGIYIYTASSSKGVVSKGKLVLLR